MPFVNFAKKMFLLFLRFSPEFRCSNISAVTEHTRNQMFFERYPKKIFLQNLHFGPIRWVPRRFFKILIFIGEICILIRDFWVIFENYRMRMQHMRKWFYRMLSIRGTDFIAHWAYWELISSHAEQCLKVEYLRRIEYDFQKSHVTGPWDHKGSVSAKK